MKSKTDDLTSHNFESYERHQWCVTVTLRQPGGARRRIKLHSLDLKSILAAMRVQEEAYERAARSILDVAAGTAK